MNFNYRQICSDIVKDLPLKQKEVVLRRFGLNPSALRQTLEAIGRDFGITRERVRQVEEDGLSRIEPKAKDYQKVFLFLKDYLIKEGGLKKESVMLEKLAGSKDQNPVYFLLSLNKDLKRFSESPDFYAFWILARKDLASVDKKAKGLIANFAKTQKPLWEKEIKKTDFPYFEISKKIQKNKENLWGLKEWPEINPRGVKDRAYIVFKKAQRPLHFTEAAKLLGKALPQTVHNELIKDSRFVLVGRGLYALREWGYEPGFVKDVISQVIRQAQKPISKEVILENVLKQREVKENTILLNLSNRKYFLKTPEGLYSVNEA